MLKELLKLSNGKALDVQYPIILKDSKGNEVYSESSSGFCYKREFDSNDNEIYYESSSGYWSIRELDSKGNETYYENSKGIKHGVSKKDKKEITIEEIEKKIEQLLALIKEKKS